MVVKNKRIRLSSYYQFLITKVESEKPNLNRVGTILNIRIKDIIGKWDQYYNFDGSGNYHQTILIVKKDGTWTDATGGSGKWTLVGTLFTLNFESGYTYSGLLSGGVVCGANGKSGNQNPPNTAFYFVKQTTLIAAAEESVISTEV